MCCAVCKFEKERSKWLLRVTRGVVSNGHQETYVIQHVCHEARGAGASKKALVREGGKNEERVWLPVRNLRGTRIELGDTTRTAKR